MEFLMIFLSAALTASATENAAFVRALGLNKSTLLLKSPMKGILFGGTFTWMIALSSLLVSLCNYILQDVSFVRAVRAPLYLACILFVYVVTYIFARLYAPATFEKILPVMPLATLNTALFGAFYISAMSGFSVLQTTGYALGTGLGYTVALLIIYYARKRLAISPVPRSFRGLPILLVYLGLLSLAIYGLIGHGLPV